MDATAYLGTSSDIDLSSGVRSCIARGEPLDGGYRSAWYDGDGRFLLAGHGCGAMIHAAPLEGWIECGTHELQPPECAWLCAQDVCPGEIDSTVLLACDGASPCTAVSQDYDCVTINPDLQCVHAALAERTPGRYAVNISWPNQYWNWIFVVSEDGSVQVTLRETNTGACGSVFNGSWQRSRTCELADPEFFTVCAEAMSWCGGGLDYCQLPGFADWFLGCSTSDAACE